MKTPNDSPKSSRKSRWNPAILALLQHATRDKAAEAAGINTAALYRWQKDPEFQAALLEARREVFGQAMGRVQQASNPAVDTPIEIMNEGEISPVSLQTLAKPRTSQSGKPALLTRDIVQIGETLCRNHYQSGRLGLQRQPLSLRPSRLWALDRSHGLGGLPVPPGDPARHPRSAPPGTRQRRLLRPAGGHYSGEQPRCIHRGASVRGSVEPVGFPILGRARVARRSRRRPGGRRAEPAARRQCRPAVLTQLVSGELLFPARRLREVLVLGAAGNPDGLRRFGAAVHLVLEGHQRRRTHRAKAGHPQSRSGGKLFDLPDKPNRIEPMTHAATRLLAWNREADTPVLLAACDGLIAHDRAGQAIRIWNKLAELHRIPYPVLAPDSGRSLTNGDFTMLPISQGFDWRLPGVGGVATLLDERPAGLRISFSGRQPENCDVLNQFRRIRAGALLEAVGRGEFVLHGLRSRA